MELHGNDFVYEVVPPQFGGQTKLLALSAAELKAAKDEYPEASPTAQADLATERMKGNSDYVWFGLKAIGQRSVEDLEQFSANAYNDYGRDKATELIKGKAFEQLKNHVASINNLVVGGQPITTLEQLRDTDSCREYYQWVCSACSSVTRLTQAERKNFMPGSDSPV